MERSDAAQTLYLHCRSAGGPARFQARVRAPLEGCTAQRSAGTPHRSSAEQQKALVRTLCTGPATCPGPRWCRAARQPCANPCRRSRPRPARCPAKQRFAQHAGRRGSWCVPHSALGRTKATGSATCVRLRRRRPTYAISPCPASAWPSLSNNMTCYMNLHTPCMLTCHACMARLKALQWKYISMPHGSST